jgi:nitric oxide reductase subunit B
MNDIKLLRNGAIVSFVVTVAFLMIGGYFAMQKIPPIPQKVACEVVSASQPELPNWMLVAGKWTLVPSSTPSSGLAESEVVMTRDDIMRGQDVYQSHGLMDHGSVWGMGTYRGMDFSADTLHRIGQAMRDYRVYANAFGNTCPWISKGILPKGIRSSTNLAAGMYDHLPPNSRPAIDAEVTSELRGNRYDEKTRTLELTPAQAYALDIIREYWDKEFGEGDPRVGFMPNTIADPADRKAIADFFFWTAWAAGTNRPGHDYSYTNNWPPDKSVGNVATPEALVWSIGGIISLFMVLGAVVYIVHRYRFFHGSAKGVAAALRLLQTPLAPSQLASAKFFLVAGLLFVGQILNGGLLANYTVNPGHFYVEQIGQTYSYAWAKTWHLQLAILWIAISWMGTAIFVAPMIAGREPKGQRFLVNLLFIAAVAVAVLSLLGEVIGLKGMFGTEGMKKFFGEHAWFWFGHQGWTYLELGRFWQVIIYRGMVPIIHYRRKRETGEEASGSGAGGGATSNTESSKPDADTRSLVIFYALSAIFVVAFFGFGLLYGRGTHLTVADFWRWFVVHIWVESIFEFFGIAVVALFLVTLGLVSARSALRVAYLTAILVFLGGMLGTAHHYFWTGGPSFWLAIGSVFSSLEPIPLILLVVRAWMEYQSIREAGQEFPYKWPLFFLVGAAVFGFVINLPIVNYYEHGTYLTINHAHTALFGVYGMLAIALILFSWRGLVENRYWSDRILKISFWGLNGGLALMFLTSLLPMGIAQVWYVFTRGAWWARSADFYELPLVKALAMWRIVPDTILIVVGALPLVWFLLKTYPRLRRGKANQSED